MILAAAPLLLALAQEYRSYSNFPAPERWVEAGVSDTGVVYAVQTGSIRQEKDKKEGFTYRAARLRAVFPANHGTGIQLMLYHQAYRCDTRQVAMTFTVTTYRDDTPMAMQNYPREEWAWEEFSWLPKHEQVGMDIVCKERM